MDKVIPAIKANEDQMIAIRRQIHANPEVAYEEHETSDLVARYLAEWGYEVHRGLAKTGVVGQLKRGSGKKSIGLRADMDALPIFEMTGLKYASKKPGKMHACGHDGHTAMLLSAAYYLATEGKFDGTLNVIFQPAEEGKAGAQLMIEEGLFARFPCDAVFGMHNMPGIPVGKFGFLAGPMMASADEATITITGKGGHGAMPQFAIDPVVVASSLVMALQSIVARNVDPQETAIVTVGAILAGDAHNVIPNSCEMRLTIRSLNPVVRDQLQERITRMTKSHVESFGATAEVTYKRSYPVLVNHQAETDFARQVVAEWLGEEGLIDIRPATGSEDFAYMLEQRPGTYCILGNGTDVGGCMVHNPGYDFNDECLSLGASYWVHLTEKFLS